METKNKVAVIVTAAGSSTRMGGDKKEFLPTAHTKGTVLSAATEPFFSACPVEALVITLAPGSGTEGIEKTKKALFASPILQDIFAQDSSPKLFFTEGGATRQESVFKGLLLLQEKYPVDVVLIHDGARPFITADVISKVYKKVLEQGAAACGVPPVDTPKEVDKEGKILRHLNRSSLTSIQTPQGFLFKPLLEAHIQASTDGIIYTDDTAIWNTYVGSVFVTEGCSENKKITYPEDIYLLKGKTMNIRTGLGYDLHRLTEDRNLMLGGVHIPYHKGELGHSDGDVLLHAITDALLGAAAISDIGEMFPPSHARWKDCDSKQFLLAAWEKVKNAGWQLGNIDCVIAIEAPKILPFRNAIRESIANILGVSIEQIFVKAKTAEKLGAIGSGDAVEVWATCLLQR